MIDFGYRLLWEEISSAHWKYRPWEMESIVAIVQELCQIATESLKFFSIEFKILRLDSSMMLLRWIFLLISTNKTTILRKIKAMKLSAVFLSFKNRNLSLKMSLNRFLTEHGDRLWLSQAKPVFHKQKDLATSIFRQFQSDFRSDCLRLWMETKPYKNSKKFYWPTRLTMQKWSYLM